MKLSNNSITITNTILIILSLFLLIKTSDSTYLFDLDKSQKIRIIFDKIPYGNTEISALSASVLAAYIFYLINTYLPRAKQDREYREQVSPLIEEILDKAAGIFRLLNEQSGQYIKFPVSDYSKIKDLGSFINFGDIFHGVMVFDSYSPPISASFKEIEYHILRNSNECITKIHDIRTKNIILDHSLLRKLQLLEDTLKLTLESFALMSNTTSRNNGFKQVANIYERVYITAQNLMLYYNKSVKLNKKYADCDIWFNKNTRNYERVAPSTQN